MRAILAQTSVVPVVTVSSVAAAVELARALVAGGLPVIEITLRTAAALDAVRAIRAEVPDAIAGVGTVVSEDQFERAVRSGARFAVSPGATQALIDAARGSGLPYLPAVATASEALRLREQGFEVLKFFPAETCGGTRALSAFAAALPEIRFCPTGGLTEVNARSYLALPNVVAVGGSWMMPADAVERGAWDEISAAARRAAALRPPPGD